MKSRFLLLLANLLLLTISFSATAQKSCCSVSTASGTFASMGNDQGFRESHPVPMPFSYQESSGRFITFKAMDGVDARAFEIKAANGSNNYLLVFHEFWGLNDYIKKESARLHKDLGNVNILAIDLYDGRVGTTREEATKLMQSVDSKRAVAIVEGAVRYAGADARIATIGWCFGGTWALQTALHADQQAIGCVMFYGQPETDVQRLSDLDCSVLGIFASQDKWITPKVAEQFEQNMKTAGKKLTVKMYNADHGFANPSNPKFQEKLAQEANAAALQYLQTAYQAKR